MDCSIYSFSCCCFSQAILDAFLASSKFFCSCSTRLRSSSSSNSSSFLSSSASWACFCSCLIALCSALMRFCSSSFSLASFLSSWAWSLALALATASSLRRFASSNALAFCSFWSCFLSSRSAFLFALRSASSWALRSNFSRFFSSLSITGEFTSTGAASATLTLTDWLDSHTGLGVLSCWTTSFLTSITTFLSLAAFSGLAGAFFKSLQYKYTYFNSDGWKSASLYFLPLYPHTYQIRTCSKSSIVSLALRVLPLPWEPSLPFILIVFKALQILSSGLVLLIKLLTFSSKESYW